MIKSKKVLVTGGAGFIGITLCQKLLREGNLVVVMDNFNEYYGGKEERLSGVLSEFEQGKEYFVHNKDLIYPTVFNQMDLDFDYIFHLAAQAGVRYSMQNPVEVTKNNVESSVNVFEYACKLSSKKVIYASSSSVYGNPIYTPLDEKHPKNPISPYAVSKLTGEIYADYYFRQKGLPVTSLRFYTVYGPRQRPDMAIRKFFNLMLQDKEIMIYGDGEQLRDFTYISDIVNGLILAAESPNSAGEIFNLGCSNPIKVIELVSKMYEISGKKQKLKFMEKQEGDVDVTHSDITKAKDVLGYTPKVFIDEGLQKTFEWQSKFSAT
jgi:UDP-glucose 4-epimerase